MRKHKRIRLEDGSADKPMINGVALESLPIRAEDTNIPLSRLVGFVVTDDLRAPIGYWVGKQLFVYNDWRLRALQARLGVEVSPDPNSLIVVLVFH